MDILFGHYTVLEIKFILSVCWFQENDVHDISKQQKSKKSMTFPRVSKRESGMIRHSYSQIPYPSHDMIRSAEQIRRVFGDK